MYLCCNTPQSCVGGIAVEKNIEKAITHPLGLIPNEWSAGMQLATAHDKSPCGLRYHSTIQCERALKLAEKKKMHLLSSLYSMFNNPILYKH